MNTLRNSPFENHDSIVKDKGHWWMPLPSTMNIQRCRTLVNTLLCNTDSISRTAEWSQTQQTVCVCVWVCLCVPVCVLLGLVLCLVQHYINVRLLPGADGSSEISILHPLIQRKGHMWQTSHSQSHTLRHAHAQPHTLWVNTDTQSMRCCYSKQVSMWQ